MKEFACKEGQKQDKEPPWQVLLGRKPLALMLRCFRSVASARHADAKGVKLRRFRSATQAESGIDRAILFCNLTFAFLKVCHL